MATRNKILLIGIVFMFLIVVGVVIAEDISSEDLESELSNLSSELVDGGYDWLVDYSLGYDSVDVEVYLEGGAPVGVPTSADEGKVVAVISNVSSDGLYRSYLDGSSGVGLGRLVNGSWVGVMDGEGNVVNSSSVFDLKVKDVKIPYNIFQKKNRIDEIQELLKN